MVALRFKRNNRKTGFVRRCKLPRLTGSGVSEVEGLESALKLGNEVSGGLAEVVLAEAVVVWG